VPTELFSKVIVGESDVVIMGLAEKLAIGVGFTVTVVEI
jgi:hypothetical protein